MHFSDVVCAVKHCLEYGPAGVYSMMGDVIWMNVDLAELIEWDGYEWVDNPLKYQMPILIGCEPPVSLAGSL